MESMLCDKAGTFYIKNVFKKKIFQFFHSGLNAILLEEIHLKYPWRWTWRKFVQNFVLGGSLSTYLVSKGWYRFWVSCRVLFWISMTCRLIKTSLFIKHFSVTNLFHLTKDYISGCGAIAKVFLFWKPICY